MIAQNLLTLLIALPFLGAIIAATMPRGARNSVALLAGAVFLAMLGLLAGLHPSVTSGEVVATTLKWVPSLGLNLRFRLDGFAWLMLLLVAGIGILVVIYARYYLAATEAASRFHALILAFSGAMSGLLLSGNVIMLVVFWELTSLCSFLLISYWHQKPEARRGARIALTVTAGGGLCLLAAMVMMGHIAGGYELDTVLSAAADIRTHPLYPVILVLTLLAAFTKSAQVPFQFWLPNAMAAPTPVSAYLHSATMVNAGVFLLVRFYPVLGSTDAWFGLVVVTGMATLIFGAVMALVQNDLKGVLAYSTISHLGLITALTGIGSPTAIVAAMFHIVNHAVFKASLFMAMGIVDHETGTRDIRRLSGLRRWMPETTWLAVVASASMAGVPLLNGFLSKEMFFEAAFAWNNGSTLDDLLPYLATLAGAFSVAYSLRLIVEVFFGPPATDLPKFPPHEPPSPMRRPVEILVILCLAIGILPGPILGTTLQDAAVAVLGSRAPTFDLKVWHGVNMAFIMSVVAMVAGTALFFLFRRRIAGLADASDGAGERGGRAFDTVMWFGLERPAQIVTRLFTARGLRQQLVVILIVSLIFAAVVAPGTRWMPVERGFGLDDAVFALMWLVGGACAIGTAWQAKYHRFAALVLLGGVGVMTVLSYAWLSAPDLAVTQLLVELTTTVLLLLGLRWLPKRDEEFPGDRELEARLRRGRDLVLAIAAGAGVAAISYAVMTAPAVPGLGDWFLRNAYSEGGGTNAVNVILVDFRAFDTFGEIVVLAIVALTVFALLRRFRPAPESANPPRAQGGGNQPPLADLIFVPSILMRWMFPVTVLMAVYFFLRGHDLPGGGFAAGVTLAIGLMVQYLATSVRWIEGRITVLPVRWVAFGLNVAALVGIGSWLFRFPFLTAHAQYVTLPVIGPVPAATAMLFDLGVFAVVAGAVTLIVIALAHQSLRVGHPPDRGPEPLAETGGEP